MLALPVFAQTTLRSADIHPDGYPTVDSVKYFGEIIEKKTNGKYKVQVLSSGQLGGEKNTIEHTRFGVISMINALGQCDAHAVRRALFGALDRPRGWGG